MKIILISGRKQNGKDSIADYLVKFKGYSKKSFASELKKMSAKIIPLLFDDNKSLKETEEKDFENEDFKKQIISSKYNTNIITFRLFLQLFGTDFVRKINNDFWIDKTITNIEKSKKDKIVISDTRFKNEIYKIKDYFGEENVTTIRVERNYSFPTKIKYAFDFILKSVHISERDLDFFKFDYFIKNNDDLKSLYSKIEDIIGK